MRRSLLWRAAPEHEADGRFSWPQVAVVVPVTGQDPQLHACLTSLLTLDYPAYEVILITADLGDPATAVVQQVLRQHPRGRHVVSGPAVTSSQKNHNLVAGLRALTSGPEILVFCDANHVAPPHFLKELVRPLAAGEALMTTGFHRVVPQDRRLATLGMVVTVLIIHLCHGHAGLVQPWGGATAVWRVTFEACEVARLWAATVVDDVALALRLRRHGIQVRPVATACLDTPMAGVTLAAWLSWLTRQLLYIKYFMPGTWLAAALLAYFLVVPPLLALGAVVGGAAGVISWGFVLAGAVYLLLLLGLALGLRSLAPVPIPWGRWLPAVALTWVVFAFSYFKTWWTHTLSWRHISYCVTFGGFVRQVIRP